MEVVLWLLLHMYFEAENISEVTKFAAVAKLGLVGFILRKKLKLMEMNIIETRTIGKIILNENTPQRNPRFEHFFIPYYQRGYRWETHHVEALLDDIHNFILSKEENYCLQPIVLVAAKDKLDMNIWEIIDGQQRLITLYIIFQYIQKPKYSIIFGQRPESTDFLQSLTKETYNHDSPDFHFMSNAYEIVANWFDEKTKNDIGYIDEFYTTITKKYKLFGIKWKNYH